MNPERKYPGSGNSELPYESKIHSLDSNVQDEAILLAINAAGAEFQNYPPETQMIIGRMMEAMIMESAVVSDKYDCRPAQQACVRGIVTGLYIAQESYTESLTIDTIIGSMRDLCPKDDDGIMYYRQLLHEGERHYSQTSQQAKSILSRWAMLLPVAPQYDRLYNVGFGLVIAGAAKAAAEIEFFKQLELSDWSVPTEERSIVALQSVDNDCRRLVASYQRYWDIAASMYLSDKEREQSLEWVAGMVRRECGMMTDLQYEDCLQTRGDGICLVQDEDGIFQDFKPVTDDIRARGKFMSVEILPVPTEYALISQDFDDENAFEPTLCLLFESAELVEPVSGDVLSKQEGLAVPLRTGGMRIDKVIYQAES